MNRGDATEITIDADLLGRPRLTGRLHKGGGAEIVLELQRPASSHPTSVEFVLSAAEALDLGLLLMRAGGHGLAMIEEIDLRSINSLEDAKRAFHG